MYQIKQSYPKEKVDHQLLESSDLPYPCPLVYRITGPLTPQNTELSLTSCVPEETNICYNGLDETPKLVKVITLHYNRLLKIKLISVSSHCDISDVGGDLERFVGFTKRSSSIHWNPRNC